jgi:hypothetical protein
VPIFVSRYAANNFYIDSGAADAYVLTLSASMTNPVSATVGYFEGMTIRFRAGNAGTGGAATVNVGGAGVKSLKEADGSTNPSSILTTEDSNFRYDGTVFRKVNNNVAASTTVSGIVELLTNAELAAGTDTTRAATAAALLSLFGASTRGGTGNLRLANNVGGQFKETIIKYGLSSSTINSSSTMTVSFASAFPNACNFAIGCFKSDNNLGVTDTSLMVDTFTTSQVVFDRGTNGGGASHPLYVYWLAIGY